MQLGGILNSTKKSLSGSENVSMQIQHQQEKGKRIRDENQTLRDENQTLRDEMSLSREELNQNIRTIRGMELQIQSTESISRDVQECHERLEMMERENRQLQEQVAKFRNIIINSGESEAVNDSTIVAQFVLLRVMIQKIVLKFYEVNQDITRFKFQTRKESDFFDLWFNKEMSITRLNNRTRGMIFELLGEEILCTPCFGLDGELETGLVKFEALLSTASDVNEADVAEWRTRTMKCASFLQPQENSSRPAQAANKIQNFMRPLLPCDRDQAILDAGNEHLSDHLLKLCTAAFRFMLMLRRSKDVYKCELPVPGKRLNPEEDEPMYSEKSEDPRIDAQHVAFALSGALVKYPEYDPTQRLVLEKAHVIIGV
ncbi:hypothetical protein B7494_g7668 [Chlorociboria aeruginascens]|nr:hypothetical protein B7494_g7668 [Chlorociboria aeruginascens]